VNEAAATDILPVVSTALAGAAAFFSTGAYGLMKADSRMWGPVVSRGDPAGGAVALTFDDGPLPGSTDRILETLHQVDARATFFVIGRYVKQFPDLVRRIHAEGHLVANHTHEHLHTGLFGRYRYWFRELKRCDDAIEEIIGVRPALFRPPMGYKHWHLTNAAADLGHRVVTWSRRALDVKARPVEYILERLLEPARGGDVMVLHDGHDPCLAPQDRRGTIDSVRPLVEGLRRRGLEPARLDVLLRIRAYHAPAAAAPHPPPTPHSK
jgi:peptidoglycan/xylan/chitin deacetylase (PgdA/CDA1 family)